MWDASATGKLLGTFDITARRNFVEAILPAGYQINHYRYAAPGVHASNGRFSGYVPNSENCNYYKFLGYQAGGNSSDPSTQQSYASFMYIPGAPIDGPGMPLQGTANTFPFDTWWDVWTISDQSYGFQGCTDTNHMPPNSLFLNTGMFTPMDPSNPDALGIYKVWLFQPNCQGHISQIETPSDAAAFWTSGDQGSVNFHFSSAGAPPDPDNY